MKSETDPMTLKPENTPEREQKPPKPKRFYKNVAVINEKGEYAITLDDRKIKTPMKMALTVSNEQLANAIAAEWEQQKEFIDSETMIITKMTNTAIDRVAPRKTEIIEELVTYAGSDLICYRAEEPASLVETEKQNWDPFLTWFKDEKEINLKLATGIIHVQQDPEVLEKITHLYEPLDEFALTALYNITTMLGSALLPLSYALGHGNEQQIWSAAHIEEDYQIARWGEDEQAALRRAKRKAEFDQTTAFYSLVK